MRIVIVGAGISGLFAANELAQRHEVIVLDKGKTPGGRCATRRIGEATFDHGAQFFTTRTEQFELVVAKWVKDGVAREWCRGFSRSDGAIGGSTTGDGYPRYVGTRGMTTITKYLSGGIDVRCSSFVFSITRRNGPQSWCIRLDDGSEITADALIVTAPLAQSYSLLITAEVEMPEALYKTEYDRTLTLLATLNGPTNISEPGALQEPSETVSFVADNLQKQISKTPSITLNASAAFSASHWDTNPDETHALLREHAQQFLGSSKIVESQLKRWRFATPQNIWPESCWVNGSLALAGDAFAGPRIEGAALSGLAAAAAILSE